MQISKSALYVLMLSLCCFVAGTSQGFSASKIVAAVSVNRLRVEQLDAPFGIDVQTPRLSWQIQSSQKNVKQTAYQVLVASSIEKLSGGEGDLWNSGKVQGDASIWVPYQGIELKSNQRCYWKVKVFTTQGETSWSEPAMWSMGLLSENNWRGQWIGLDKAMPWESETQWSRLGARYLRKEFAVGKTLKQATLHICGLGLYEAYINGKKVGDQVLAPAPTDYRKTVLYNSFDITSMLGADNAIGVVLGNGRFYTMRQNYKPYKIPNFGYPKMRLNIILEYTDGTKEVISTDAKWKLTADGAIRSNNEYDGEEYDANKEMADWTKAGFDDSKWMDAQRVSIPDGTLRAAMTPNMKVMERIQPVSIRKQGNKYILDMGQNMAGWIRMKVRAAKGDTIRLRFAETLQPDGEIYVRNLRDAHVTDTYIANGKEQGREWAPCFTYHGFRYVEITGYKQPSISDFTGELVYDDMETIGSFSCSNATINQIYKNAYWGIRDNYKGMPVDCPQRNERQPWLGDRSMGSWGESYLFENGMLYSKWMHDICDAQRSDGCIPDVAPAFWNYYSDNVTWPSTLWMASDMIYTQFGNTRPVEQAYPNMKRWVEHMQKEYLDKDYIISKDKYGDWCMPPESLELIHSKDPKRQTDGALLASAYYIKILQTMHRFAELQGLADDAQHWADLEGKMKDAFNKKFLTVKPGTSPVPGHPLYPDSIFYGNNTATANILPLAFGLVPKEYIQEVVDNVTKVIITDNGGHICCGVIGTQWMLRELCKHGRADVAFLLASNTSYPSWGYMVEQGATTIWELWNGNTANPEMNSGNHVMLLGDFIPFCYNNLAGIQSSRKAGETGFKHIIMKPNFDVQDLSSADASYITPYGKVVSRWKKTLAHLDWDVEIPCNTTAEVHLPNGKVEQIGSGTYHFSVEIPMSDAAVLTDEFLYEDSGFPECHGATIVEVPNGDLVAAFFGGTKEKNPDCCIWVSRKPKGAAAWSAPVKAAEGILTATTRSAFSDKDLRQLALRDSLMAIELKKIPNATADDKAKLYIKILNSLQMGGIKEAPIAYPIGNGKVRSPWLIPLANNTDKMLKDETWRKPCYNPVLFQIPGGDLILYFKIGSSVSDWTGWLVRSKNGGKTWSKIEALPKDFLGPIKNKPEWIDGSIVAPSSTEVGGWKFHFEISPDKGENWQYIGPLEAELSVPTQLRKAGDSSQKEDIEAGGALNEKGAQPILCIQPSILKLADGRLQALGRTRNAHLATAFSSDRGKTWSKVTLMENLPNNNSGTDAVTLQDGRHLLIYNDFATLDGTPKGVRTPLCVAVSTDGTSWRNVLTLENSPISQYSYPSIVQGKDGKVHAIYTWRRQRIKYVEIDPSKIK